MSKGILGDREKALEDSYFRQQDAKLLDSLRKGAALDEIAVALSEKLQVDDPELLVRAREAGITAETAAAFLLAPLVQVAWAEGSVTKQERAAALRLAVHRGVDAQSPAYSQLEEWLDVRPPDALFEVASRVIQRRLSVLPPKERDERIECRKKRQPLRVPAQGKPGPAGDRLRQAGFEALERLAVDFPANGHG